MTTLIVYVSIWSAGLLLSWFQDELLHPLVMMEQSEERQLILESKTRRASVCSHETIAECWIGSLEAIDESPLFAQETHHRKHPR